MFLFRICPIIRIKDSFDVRDKFRRWIRSKQVLDVTEMGGVMNADLNTVLKSMFKLLVQACWWYWK